MDLKTLRSDGTLSPNAVIQAMMFPVSLETASSNKFMTGDLDLRSVGIALPQSLISVQLVRPGQPVVEYLIRKTCLLILEPGTTTFVKPIGQEGWTFMVSPSGRLASIPGHVENALHEPEAAPAGSPSWVQKALDWEFNGHVGASSQGLCDALVRLPHGLPARGRLPAPNPSDPSSLEKCVRFFQAVPELLPSLPEMASQGEEWKRLVEGWSELTALLDEELSSGSAPRTYAKMKEVLGPAKKGPSM